MRASSAWARRCLSRCALTSTREAWAETFTRAVQEIPEVVEVYRMSGETDYLLRVVVSDIDDYDRVYKLLIARRAAV